MSEAFEGLEWIGGAFRANPALLLLTLTAPLVLLAYFKHIYPNAFLLIWVAVPSFLTCALLLKQDAFPLILALDLAVLGIAVVDLFSVPVRSGFKCERRCQRIASLRKNHRVELTVSNSTRQVQFVRIREGVPQQFEPTPAEFECALKPRSRTSMHYELKASRRGAFELDAIHLRVRSRLGLWQRFLRYPVPSIINVYPDMKQLSEYAVLARTNRLSLLGVRRTRRIGQDHEFERLRDYTPDDNYKHIDWRSTARRRKLTVKDFQSSQSQRIVFLVDCGRMMTNESSGISLLDHSLNAMLMLSYVALNRADSVGLITFSDQVHSFVPLAGGKNQMNHLLHASFDRFPSLVESRYQDAFLYLASRCRKRSLVILITNLIDDVNSTQVQQYLGTLTGRHLPLAVLLRDHQLFDAANVTHPIGSGLYQTAAAAEIVGWRQQVITDLQHKGVLALDVYPENITAPLINQYLEIKARHLL